MAFTTMPRAGARARFFFFLAAVVASFLPQPVFAARDPRLDVDVIRSDVANLLRRDVTCRSYAFSVDGPYRVSSAKSVSRFRASTYQIPIGALLVDDNGSDADYATIQEAVDAAPDGGAVYVCPGRYEEKINISKDLSLISLAGADRTIIDASTSGDGNPVYIAGSVTLRGFTITGATADFICYYGGGIKVGGLSGQTVNDVVIEQNKIVDNTACKAGGIYLGGFESFDGTHVDNTVTLRNNVIAGNYANTTNAGAIMAMCDNLIDTVIENNVIAGNATASGSGGIEFINGGCEDVSVRNNVFYGNLSSGAQNVVNDSSGTAVIEYNAFYDNSTDYTGGTGNVTTDPLFVDEDDYELSSASPLIDAGDPDAAYNDVDGSRNDMGAYGGEKGDW